MTSRGILIRDDRIKSLLARFQQQDLHDAAVFRIADVQIPAMRNLEADRLVADAEFQDVVIGVIDGLHPSRSQVVMDESSFTPVKRQAGEHARFHGARLA